jgi:hypothetical protein
MRFRDTLKFVLELFVPEKLMQAGRNSALDPKREASPETARNAATSSEAEPAAPRLEARRIIEELDHAQFGGPSFGPQTIELMSTALEGAEASLREPASDQQLRLIAATILKVAGDGERDPVRLKAAAMSAAMSALGPVASPTDEQPPST